MNITAKIKSPIGILILSSAMIAAALTIATATSPMSPIPTAIAAEGTGIGMDACAGQAWPHYSADCLALIAQQSDSTAPTRILMASAVSD